MEWTGQVYAATTGLSAYTCPVHSMKSRLERHCGSRLNRGTTSRVITAQAQPAAAGDPAAAAPAIHVTSLRKRYGDVTALADVDLVVRAGEFFTLLGPSGSGKTTLLRLIAGFERPDAGRIELAGRSAHPAMGEWETVSTVTECDPPHRFAWAVGDPAHPSASWRFTLKPDGEGTLLEQWYQMGPARSGLNIAIDAMPDKEAKIVFVRMREHETGMRHNLAEIKDRAERAG